MGEYADVGKLRATITGVLVLHPLSTGHRCLHRRLERRTWLLLQANEPIKRPGATSPVLGLGNRARSGRWATSFDGDVLLTGQPRVCPQSTQSASTELILKLRTGILVHIYAEWVAHSRLRRCCRRRQSFRITRRPTALRHG